MQSSDESIVPLTINCGLLGMNLMSTLSMRRHQCSTKCSNLCPSALTHPESYRCAIKEENYDACRAIIPVLQAEEAERFVKECRKYLDGEARIMKEVPGWKLGQSVDSYGRWMPPATGELHPDICPFAFATTRMGLSPPRVTAPVGASPFAFAATRMGLSPPRVTAPVGASPFAFAATRMGLSPPRVTAPVGARSFCTFPTPTGIYKHIQEIRWYRETKKEEPVVKEISEVHGMIKKKTYVHIYYQKNEHEVIDCKIEAKEKKGFGIIKLKAGITLYAQKVVMKKAKMPK